MAKLPKTQLLWGSACSGSEGAVYVADAINTSFARANWPVRLQHCFSCESCRDKQKWVHVVSASHRCEDDDDSLFGEDDENDDETHHTCIFADIQTLGKETAHCVVHNRECPVPQVDVFICGVSCKDVSRQNPSRDMSKHVLAEGQSRGGTAQTWQGFSSYVSMKQPGIVVFELLYAATELVDVFTVLGFTNNLSQIGSQVRSRSSRRFQASGFRSFSSACDF